MVVVGLHVRAPHSLFCRIAQEYMEEIPQMQVYRN